MPRTQQCLCEDIKFKPHVVYFKPQGIPMKNLEVIEISMEEIEAYRLRHIDKLEQTQAAKKLNTSTSTYQRILYSAYDKIAEALIHGKAIKIIKHI
jgi:predicted DNA-binding protein (UPF0251 family)